MVGLPRLYFTAEFLQAISDRAIIKTTHCAESLANYCNISLLAYKLSVKTVGMAVYENLISYLSR